MDLLRGSIRRVPGDAAGVEVVEVADAPGRRQDLGSTRAQLRTQDRGPGHDEDVRRALVGDRAARRAGTEDRVEPFRRSPP